MKKDVERYYTERYRKYKSLRSMLAMQSEVYNEKPFFRYILSDNNIAEMSYRTLLEYVDCIGTALFELQLNGKTIVVLSESRPEFLVTYIAAMQSESIIVPLDKELLVDQTENFIRKSEAVAVFYSPALEGKVLEIKDNLPGVKYFVRFNKDCIYEHGAPESNKNECDITFESLLNLGRTLLDGGVDTFTGFRPDVKKPAAIIFTSGTTGTSKGVLLSQDNVLSCVYVSSNRTGFEDSDELMSVLPWHHTYEMCCGILTPICLGLTVNINNNLKYVSKNLLRFKPTGLVLVPLFVSAFYKKLMTEIKRSGMEKKFSVGVKVTSVARKVGIDLRRQIFSKVLLGFGGRLRMIICGGAPLDPDFVTRFGEIGVTLSQGYGITECAPLVSVNPYFNLKYGSVGLPVYERSVKIILDGDDENAFISAPPYTVGEVFYKGPNLMLGYFNDEDDTKEAFNGYGYFRTGDLGYIDNDGYLFLTGRKKNLIILSNGKNVYPEELEEYLMKIEIIKECAVVGRDIDGEVVITAIIFPDYIAAKTESPDVISDMIKCEITMLNKKLPVFKQIRNIEIKKNEFEKSSTNKIIRYKL